MFFGRRKLRLELTKSADRLCADAEATAAAGDHKGAAKSYSDAWGLVGQAKGGVKAVGQEYAFWLLMNCVNAEWLAGDFEAAISAAGVAHRSLEGKSFGPVGNPFFHLRVAQCLWELSESNGEDPIKASLDDLARALICGGVEIYTGEADRFLQAVTSELEPPEGFATWELSRGKYRGACVELLDGARWQVLSLLSEKFERVLPF